MNKQTIVIIKNTQYRVLYNPNLYTEDEVQKIFSKTAKIDKDWIDTLLAEFEDISSVETHQCKDCKMCRGIPGAPVGTCLVWHNTTFTKKDNNCPYFAK